ncbi:MAG: tetratricopeptide repeat protein, partial [Bryobacteraceae bacterium]
VDKKSATAADMHVRIATALQSKGEMPGAVENLKLASQLLPRNSFILNSMAVMLDQLGRKPEARTAYEEALRLESENPVTLNNLAFLIANSPGGDLDQALTYVQRARQKAPQIPEINDTLGLIYLKKNLADNAVEILLDCIAKNPKHPTFRYHLGMAYYQKGEKAKANVELQSALGHSPSKEEEAGIRELLAKIG